MSVTEATPARHLRPSPAKRERGTGGGGAAGADQDHQHRRAAAGAAAVAGDIQATTRAPRTRGLFLSVHGLRTRLLYRQWRSRAVGHAARPAWLLLGGLTGSQGRGGGCPWGDTRRPRSKHTTPPRSPPQRPPPPPV